MSERLIKRPGPSSSGAGGGSQLRSLSSASGTEGPAVAPASPTVTPQASDPKRRQAEMALRFAQQIEKLMGGGFQPRSRENEEVVQRHFTALYRQAGMNLPSHQAKTFYGQVLDEVFGYGPIEPFLKDESITEVMLNGPDLVYIERKGRLVETEAQYLDEDHVMRVIDRILKPLGRHLDPKWPMVDARLPDGSRVNIIVPPCCLVGPTVTIRKFSSKRLTTNDLISFGSLTSDVAEFLQACVEARLNVVVSGGTGSGKTTLLNVLSGFIPSTERIVTIEDSAELQLHQRHVVTLESKQADPDGTGRVGIRDLVINSLRMRPDRIVVGECRGGETIDMLQAMNTGHDGSLTTLHANSPRDALARLETMALMAGMDLPVRVIREQIASAVDLIIQQARLRDGSRKIVCITEIQGMEGEVVVLQDIFVFQEEGLDSEGVLQGRFESTGIRPRFMPRLEAAGIKVRSDLFAKAGGGW